ncbi:MAG: alpha-L-fucosidase [Armatimonadota bacterium]|nr:alpha-L-fucosidase [Armatimonadota bacterium]MCX7776467.1 alpha-L-fucosidase [Armatimonadota bacterium]MDW8024265.1 alpha-L-fucosidase [Armatimonadota bacterium]
MYERHKFVLPFRQVHLDFHTSSAIDDVGADFEADEFVKVLKAASVNSITCFAKCHHGMSYYDTKVGVRHPALKFDLLGWQIEACHRADIRCPIYYSVIWDNHIAETHPEWRRMDANGKPVGAEPFQAGWKHVCINTPYVDYIEAQVNELLDGYDVDGFFFDIVFMQLDGCCCRYCFDEMKRMGLDPSNPSDRKKHGLNVTLRFMERMSNLIWSKRRNATIFYNGAVRYGFGQWAKYMSHVEIEALPTGGWGYLYFPMWVRYVRNFGLPVLGMTARFHKSWGDFGGLKTSAQLEYECGSMLANCAACSIGDQAHPRMKLDGAVYKLIGSIYGNVASKERWCIGAEPLTQIALLMIDAPSLSDYGACRMLMELHHQFDVIDPSHDFRKYELIIVADDGAPDNELVRKLRRFIGDGGKLLLSYKALLDEHTCQFALSDEMGASYIGDSPIVPDYFSVGDELSHGLEKFDYVMYERSCRVEAHNWAQVLASVHHPYFERTWEHFTSHQYAPVKERDVAPAVIRNGNVTYIYAPIFSAYHNHGNFAYRQLIANCISLLMPEKLLHTDAPSTVEATVTKQDGRLIVHLVNYHVTRRGEHPEQIDLLPELHNISIALRLDRRPTRVYIAPDGLEIGFEFDGKVVSCTIPKFGGHAMLVFDVPHAR